jgi:hypothetical protein
MNPRIYADLHNLDDDNRVRLNAVGTLRDLCQLDLGLVDGMRLTLYTDDANESGQPDELWVDAVARFSRAENIWVAVADWSTLRHASDEVSLADQNGVPQGQSGSPRLV